MTHDYKKAKEILTQRNKYYTGDDVDTLFCANQLVVSIEAAINALELAIALQPKPISEAEVDKEYVLYCPERGVTNNERFEYDTVKTSNGKWSLELD